MKKILQKWSGHVTEIMEDTYWASLKSVIGEEEDIEAEILKSKTLNADKLETGTFIDWTISENEDGSIESIIEPYIRYWTQEEIDIIKEKSKILFEEWKSLFEE